MYPLPDVGIGHRGQRLVGVLARLVSACGITRPFAPIDVAQERGTILVGLVDDTRERVVLATLGP